MWSILDFLCPYHPWLDKGRSQREKRDYVGKVPKRRTPPVWETPVIKKKLGLFLDALASLDFTLVSQSVSHWAEFRI